MHLLVIIHNFLLSSLETNRFLSLSLISSGLLGSLSVCVSDAERVCLDSPVFL